jgi:hypothetical protein
LTVDTNAAFAKSFEVVDVVMSTVLILASAETFVSKEPLFRKEEVDVVE